MSDPWANKAVERRHKLTSRVVLSPQPADPIEMLLRHGARFGAHCGPQLWWNLTLGRRELYWKQGVGMPLSGWLFREHGMNHVLP